MLRTSDVSRIQEKKKGANAGAGNSVALIFYHPPLNSSCRSVSSYNPQTHQ